MGIAHHFGKPQSQRRLVTTPMLLTALSIACLCTACSSTSDGGTAGVGDHEVESPVPIVYAVGNSFFRSAPGLSATQLAVAETDQIAETGLWAGGDVIYYISPGPSAVALHSIGPGNDAEETLAEGTIHVVATAADGRFATLEEDTERPMSLCLYESTDGEPTVMAEGVSGAACDPELGRFAYVQVNDASDSSSAGSVIAQDAVGADPITVWSLEPGQAAGTVAVSSDRVLFLVSADQSVPDEGDLYAYEFETGKAETVAESVRCLAVGEAADDVVLVSYPDATNSSTAQAFRVTRDADGDWKTVPLGESVADVSLFAEFGHDGETVLLGEATFGNADRARIYDAEGSVVGSIDLEQGAAFKTCNLSADGSSVVVVAQEASETNPSGVGRETLRVIDVDSGDTTVLATSELDTGGASIVVVGLPDDVSAWE